MKHLNIILLMLAPICFSMQPASVNDVGLRNARQICQLHHLAKLPLKISFGITVQSINQCAIADSIEGMLFILAAGHPPDSLSNLYYIACRACVVNNRPFLLAHLNTSFHFKIRAQLISEALKLGSMEILKVLLERRINNYLFGETIIDELLQFAKKANKPELIHMYLDRTELVTPGMIEFFEDLVLEGNNEFKESLLLLPGFSKSAMWRFLTPEKIFQRRIDRKKAIASIVSNNVAELAASIRSVDEPFYLVLLQEALQRNFTKCAIVIFENCPNARQNILFLLKTSFTFKSIDTALFLIDQARNFGVFDDSALQVILSSGSGDLSKASACFEHLGRTGFEPASPNTVGTFLMSIFGSFKSEIQLYLSILKAWQHRFTYETFHEFFRRAADPNVNDPIFNDSVIGYFLDLLGRYKGYPEQKALHLGLFKPEFFESGISLEKVYEGLARVYNISPDAAQDVELLQATIFNLQQYVIRLHGIVQNSVTEAMTQGSQLTPVHLKEYQEQGGALEDFLRVVIHRNDLNTLEILLECGVDPFYFDRHTLEDLFEKDPDELNDVEKQLLEEQTKWLIHHYGHFYKLTAMIYPSAKDLLPGMIKTWRAVEMAERKKGCFKSHYDTRSRIF